MSIRSVDYAFLANDAYRDREPREKVTLNGVNYLTLAVANDSSGYQATAYQRVDTGEVIIANRGTEFFKEPYRDVIKADGGMVQTGLNKQLDDAMVFANQVRGIVHQLEQRQHQPIDITVTGHSLGGTLAQIQSCRLRLHGETFNAYGAAGLAYGIPEGGNRIINHVVATDAVSAASAHFGEVRVYASAQNIADMEKAGYGLSAFPRSDANPLMATGVQAHLMKNFLPGNDLTGESIMTPLNAARYRAHHVGIDQLRNTIMEDRKVLSGEWALQGKMTPEEIANRKIHIQSQLDAVLKQRISDMVADTLVATQHTAYRTGYAVAGASEQTVIGAAQSLEAIRTRLDSTPDLAHSQSPFPRVSPLRLDDAGHPDHALYLQARDGVYKLDAEQHRTPDQRSHQLAAALTVAAHEKGLDRIDGVYLNMDASHVVGYQEGRTHSFDAFVGVPTIEALNTPIEQSSKTWEQNLQQRHLQQAQVQHVVQQQYPTKQASHGFAR